VNLLGQYKLAWVRGYEYQRYLPNIRHYTEVQRRSGILSMLDLGRADYYIDSLSEIQALLRDSPRQSSYKVTHVAELALYIGFTDSAKGHRLRTVFDQRMDELVPSGQLRETFAKWHQPYPFEGQTSVKAR
jgi:ABC-type amino acid transport substrate-binding protein